MLKIQEYREIFHFCFLEQLLRISDARLYVLKGGVNLRFFFHSPRYSEDMDLDVLGSSVETLRKNGYKILSDRSFQRILKTFGIESLDINDPIKAKHTTTTQRFRLSLVLSSGERLPTKIEFSRRAQKKGKIKPETSIRTEVIDTEIARNYNRKSYRCQHYIGPSAVLQKIAALANRPVTQARDVFDLHILALGGYTTDPHLLDPLSPGVIQKATTNAMAIGVDEFNGQVVEFLDEHSKKEYEAKGRWEELQTGIIAFIEGKGHGF